MTQYEQLMARLGGELAQGNEPIPVRVYDGKQVKMPPCSFALWVEGKRAWAGFEERKALVTAPMLIDLLLKMGESGGLDVEA